MLFRELTRPATHQEVAAALRAEVASRWQRLSSGQISPSAIGYTTADGMATQARRVGIVPAASCAQALDPDVASQLAKQGCVTVLRATYVDSSGTLVVTEGVAVLRSPAAAAKALASFGFTMRTGVLPVAFPGTLSASFHKSSRVLFNASAQGPYLFLSSAGYTSGQVGHSASSNPALADLANGVTSHVTVALTSGIRPCEREDIRC